MSENLYFLQRKWTYIHELENEIAYSCIKFFSSGSLPFAVAVFHSVRPGSIQHYWSIFRCTLVTAYFLKLLCPFDESEKASWLLPRRINSSLVVTMCKLVTSAVTTFLKHLYAMMSLWLTGLLTVWRYSGTPCLRDVTTILLHQNMRVTKMGNA